MGTGSHSGDARLTSRTSIGDQGLIGPGDDPKLSAEALGPFAETYAMDHSSYARYPVLGYFTGNARFMAIFVP